MVILKVHHIFRLYLMNKFHLGYSPPHRNHVSEQMEVLYHKHYQLLKEELKQVHGLSITFDFWSNRQMQSFLCITGHWLTDSIDPVSKVIDFSMFIYRHTGLDIARVVKEKLVALDIDEKIVCITCDGAQNMIAACYYLNDEIPRLWCVAHRLHLVVINGLGFWLSEDVIKEYRNSLLTTHVATTSAPPSLLTAGTASLATTAAPEPLPSAGAASLATTSAQAPLPTAGAAAAVSLLTASAASLSAKTTTTTTVSSFIDRFDDDEGMDFNWNDELNEGNHLNKVSAYVREK